MKSKIWKIIKIAFVAAVIFFLFRFLKSNVDELKQAHFQFRIFEFVLAIFFFILYKLMQGFLWHYITVKNNSSIDISKSLISYFYSQLGKYIPGKIFLLGGRLYYYHIEGISKKKVTFCFFVENICTLLGAAFLFLFSLLFIHVPIFSQYRYAVIILIILFFIVIDPRIFQTVMNTALKLLKKPPVVIDMTYKNMLEFVFLFIINWLLLGIGFYILVESIYPVGMQNFFFVSGSFALAVIIGLLSLFAPMGIGVREGIMVFALQYIMPETVAVVISVVSRLWATLGEFMIIGAIFVYAKIRNIQFKQNTEK